MRSSTKIELVNIDNAISRVLWMKQSIEAQGHNVAMNIVYHNSQSSMKIEENGKSNLGKHTQIKYFYITDLIKQNEMKIEYCLTNAMIADYIMRQLVNAKSVNF